MKVITLLVFSLTLFSCSKRADINELTHHFFEHQSAFNKLTDIACALNSSLNTQFHNYKIDTAMEYPEHLATQFIKVNSLLRRINAEGIAISPPSDDKLECSLFISHWAFGFAGAGSEIGYSYNPSKLEKYDAAIHQPENMNFREYIHFTKYLANNWHIEYVNNP